MLGDPESLLQCIPVAVSPGINDLSVKQPRISGFECIDPSFQSQYVLMVQFQAT
jgi:hypothetical protein